ncbi:MAG: STAS domain-containing protein, partial [Gammaproteobacteria bacterium]
MAALPAQPVESVEVVAASPGRLAVNGALTFATARRAHEAGLDIIRANDSREPLQIDCAGVTDSDSAGLAVLVDWIANAKKQGRTLTFANLPAGIRAA